MTLPTPLPTGSIAALATPFRDGHLDEPALARMAERQEAAGTAALVICGSTGEAPTLTPDEHSRAIVGIVAATRLPVIAGCGAQATDAAAALARAAARAGARALLLAAPAYIRPTQSGIVAHVRAVAHAADLPIMLYDVPSRTGVAIADETVARLFESGLIAAFKDATSDLARPPRLRALCGTGLAQYTGDDPTAVAHRAMGGVGCVSVTANVAPALCAALHAAWDRGALLEVGRLRDLLDPLHAALFAESNPIPLKAALAALGLCGPELRLPLTRASEATRSRLADALDRVMPFERRGQPLQLAMAG